MQTAPAPTQSELNLSQPVRTILESKQAASKNPAKPLDVWCISPEASVYEAIEQMSDRRIGALVVVSSGFVAGLVSERDYARKVILKGRSSHETKVREIMTSPVLFVTPNYTVDECMRLLTSRRIRHLPVMENDHLVGMLSIGDLVNWIIELQDSTITQLHHYIAGSYPV